jgi:hypothetical protein
MNNNYSNQSYMNNNLFDQESTLKPNNLISYNDDDKINPNTIKVSNNTHQANLETDVEFKLTLKHEVLKEGTGPTILPLLATLCAKDVQTETKANIDLVCLLDKSGSMRGNKMNLLKDSFNNIMEYLSDGDRMSLVIFDSNANRITPLMCMNAENKIKTLSALSQINASGGTSIGNAFYHAMEILKQRRYINSVTSVLILSDGLDGGAESLVKSHLLTYDGKVGSTFTINTFGYGSDHDPKMMSALSDLKDGSFNFIDKLDMVDEIFVDCLGGLISVVAQNVKICIEANTEDHFLPGIRIQKAYGIDGFWKEKEQGKRYEAEILQLIAGKKYEYIFEVFIPKLENLNTATRTFLVAKATANLKDLQGKQVIKESDCVITFADEEDIPNENISLQTFRVQCAEAIKAANVLSENKQYDKAQNLLKDMKREMENSLYKDLPYIQNLIKDVESAINNVKPEVYEAFGKHYLHENFKANMCQVSNKNSANVYSNSCQFEMVEKVKAKKMNKK